MYNSNEKGKSQGIIESIPNEVFLAGFGLIIGVMFFPALVLGGITGILLYLGYRPNKDSDSYLALISRALAVVVFMVVLAHFIKFLSLELYPKEVFKWTSFFRKASPKESFQNYVDMVLVIFPVFGLGLAYFLDKKADREPRGYESLSYGIRILCYPMFIAEIFAGHDTTRKLVRFGHALYGFCFSLFLTTIGHQLIIGNLFEITFGLSVTGYLMCLYGVLNFYVWFKSHIIGYESRRSQAPMADDLVPIGFLSRSKKLFLKWRDLNHHIHVIGQPGSGKSVLLRSIYGSLIKENKGLMMIDLKADVDVLNEITGTAQAFNRLNDLKILSLNDPEISVGYNPLFIGNATELKDKIIMALEWSEPYYKKVSEDALLTIMRGLVILRDKKNQMPTLSDVVEALSKPVSLEMLAEVVGPFNQDVKSDLRVLAKSLKEKSFYDALTSLRSDLNIMVKSEFGELLTSKPSIDLFNCVFNSKIFYVLLDSQTYGPSSIRVARMLLSDLRSVSGKLASLSEEVRPKFTVIIDEFSDIVSNIQIGQLFTGFLNKCRGSGIGVVIAHQSLGDFQDQNLKKQVLDSTETIFSFVQKDPETAEILSSLAGTKEVSERTYQVRDSLLGDQNTGLGSSKKVHEYIYHPNIFKNLDVGQCVYIAKKPSRHGIVNTFMFELPKQSPRNLNGAINIPDFHNEYEWLNLKKLSLSERNLEIKPEKERNSDIPADFQI